MTNNVDNYFKQPTTDSNNDLVLNGIVTSTNNVGEVATGSIVTHIGDGTNMRAIITVDTTLPAIAGGG